MDVLCRQTDPDQHSVYMSTDNDKEVALASAPALRPDFSSKNVTKEQLEKLQALRQQRLQLKCTNKYLKKAQRDHKNVEIQKLDSCYIHDAKANDNIHTHRGSLLDANNNKRDNANFPRRKPQKLRWGLDTKARWEQKGNM